MTTGVVCVVTGILQSPRASASHSDSSIRDRAGSRQVETQSRRVVTRRGSWTDAEQARLYSSLDRNPFTTNQQSRARVGNKIAASTVSRYLARAKPPCTAKVVPRPGARRTNRGMEGRGTEMVERVIVDEHYILFTSTIAREEFKERGVSNQVPTSKGQVF